MNSAKKSQNVFAHSPSLQILWKCASQRRLITKTLINSASFKNIYKDVLHYVNAKNRRRSPLALILDSHLMVSLVYVYSKTVILWQQDVEKLYKDAVVHRFFEFEDAAKLKVTRRKETAITGTEWQIEIDENLLPDERILLERDFSIEIPRQPTTSQVNQPPEELLAWEVSKRTHGKRITLPTTIEEPAPRPFDIIADGFGEPLPIAPTTDMDIDKVQDGTIRRPTTEDISTELPRGAVEEIVVRSEDRTSDKQLPLRSLQSAVPSMPMPLMDTTSIEPEHLITEIHDQFHTDAIAFITNAIDTYPIYNLMPTKTILLGAECISSSGVPLIVVQEPTVIGTEEMVMPMDTLPPPDQELPLQIPVVTAADAQVPDVIMVPLEEKRKFHVSRKKRNTPNPLNKKRKNSSLYQHIVEFDYTTLKLIIEEDDEEYEENKEQQKPWKMLVGRNGKNRMNKLLNKAKTTITSTDLSTVVDDIMNIAKLLTNPDEHDGFAKARVTSQEMAIRRGQSSGLLPKAGTRSPSSIVPTVQERISEAPPLPIDLSEFPIIPPPEPLPSIPQPFSPLQTKRRGPIITMEPSPTWQEKQKQKTIEDIYNLADSPNGGSFNQFLKQSNANRIQATRLFCVLLVLCGENKLKVHQKEPYGEIHVFINPESNQMKRTVPDIQSSSYVEAMESDDHHF